MIVVCLGMKFSLLNGPGPAQFWLNRTIIWQPMICPPPSAIVRKSQTPPPAVVSKSQIISHAPPLRSLRSHVNSP